MRQDTSARVESIRDGILEQVRHARSVNVSEAEQSPREVRRIVVRSKQAAKLSIERLLHLFPVDN